VTRSPIDGDGVLRHGATLVTTLCLLTLAGTGLALAVGPLRDRFWSTSTSTSYAVGDVVDVPPDAYSRASHSVILFARSSCSACQASKPVMAAIANDLSTRADTALTLVAPEKPAAEQREFAEAIGIDATRIVYADLRSLRLRYVPAVVVTDRAGRVLFAREGLMTETDRLDLLRALESR
jgi:hypothetical protein